MENSRVIDYREIDFWESRFRDLDRDRIVETASGVLHRFLVLKN